MLPVFAALVAASTALLIFAGGLVTSTGSGLSVPDWPNTYGWFMWTFPLSKMVGGIFYEHLHRLIASTVGFLIVVLAVWLYRAEPRRWVRLLGYIALGAVITQGILGGITVLWYLPDAISIAHAGLAQIGFYHHGKRRELVRPALLLLALVAVQVTLGALTVLSQKQFIINSLHVVNGALVLVTSLVLTLRAHRSRFAGSSEAGSASPESSARRNPAYVPTGARA